MVINELEHIFEKISPYIYRTIKTEDILEWQNENSNNEYIKNLDFSELEDLAGLVIAGFEYNIDSPELPEGCMSISPYYYFSNIYYMKLKDELAGFEEKDGIKILKSVPLKVLANVSGLGYYGKNSIIHNEEFGSTMFLYAVGIKVDCSWNPMSSEHSDCGRCRRCIEACPTEALDEGFILDREKCIRNYMLEGIEVPEWIGKKMGKRLLGCDICQSVCPKNNRKPETEKMPDYDSEIFLVDNYLENRDKGLKKYINPLSQWIGRNYARTKRVLYQCEIIDRNNEDDNG